MSKNYDKFFKATSSDFKNIIFVPGDVDKGCKYLFDDNAYNIYMPRVHDICEKYGVHVLDDSSWKFNDNITIIGSTLWSSQKKIIRETGDHKFELTHEKYIKSFNFIKNELSENHGNKKIVVITSYIPNMKFIKDSHEYLFGQYNSFNDLPQAYFNYKHIPFDEVRTELTYDEYRDYLQQQLNNMYIGDIDICESDQKKIGLLDATPVLFWITGHIPIQTSRLYDFTHISNAFDYSANNTDLTFEISHNVEN
jgi:hypothetical protein